MSDRKPSAKSRMPRPSGDELLPRPFVKWAGGKRQLLPELLKRAPEKFKGYHEPFVGGGALFFSLFRAGKLEGKTVRLSDINAELVDTYQAVRDRVEAVIKALRVHHYDHDHYYKVRDWDPLTLELPERAGRMIFLNKSGFNGLYRVNSKGKFNVPFGRYIKLRICDDDNLRAVSKALAKVEIERAPFDNVLTHARKGDFVYFDPPYVPLSKTANFVAYARAGFAEADQEKLAEVFTILNKSGAQVMLSNSDTPWVRKTYDAFHLNPVLANRQVNSRSDKRGAIGELIVTSYPTEVA